MLSQAASVFGEVEIVVDKPIHALPGVFLPGNWHRGCEPVQGAAVLGGESPTQHQLLTINTHAQSTQFHVTGKSLHQHLKYSAFQFHKLYGRLHEFRAVSIPELLCRNGPNEYLLLIGLMT